MTTTVAISHRTEYHYDRPIELGPQVVRLRPAAHTRVPIEQYSIRIEPAKHFVNWQQDPHGNFLMRLVFPEPTDHFRISVDVRAELVAFNPFDFFLEDAVEKYPFTYPADALPALAPYLIPSPDLGKEFEAFLKTLPPKEPLRTVDFLVGLNTKLREHVNYVVRMEPGVQTPDETLSLGSGSCRDSTWLLVQLLRRLGIAARFVSGYLVQLVADREPLTGPKGPEKDFTDLHAWAEAYLPGAGWIGLDPTSGLFAGEGHIPLAATASPEEAAPISGSFAFEQEHDADELGVTFDFAMTVQRVHERPRASRPFTREERVALDALGDRVDAAIAEAGFTLTMGGEPTFVSAVDIDADEWNIDALGPTKRAKGFELAGRLEKAFDKGGFFHVGTGKWYPGEVLPRWAITVGFRTDGEPMWQDRTLVADENRPGGQGIVDAELFVRKLSSYLGVGDASVRPGFEDPFYYAWKENRLPVDVDPFDSKLDDPGERASLAKVFERGLATPTGWVLPLACEELGFRTGPWVVRDDRLRLIPGDSAMGLRLPIDSLPYAPKSERAFYTTRDPMETPPPLPGILAMRSDAEARARREREDRREAGEREAFDKAVRALGLAEKPWTQVPGYPHGVRTALCVEPREQMLHVFLPPTPSLDSFARLLAAVEATAAATHIPVRLEGYLPPSDPRWTHFQVTPDPGVLEVNVHPAASYREVAAITETVFHEARATELASDKFLLDGRHVGSGGGNHIVLGGPSPAESPFLLRPELLGSYLAYFQAHPSLSYLFSGMFIGPTSQHPRIDEARTETRWELATALAHMPIGDSSQPWLIDRLLRNILTDATGNTHRTEICVDKLYSPDGPSGRRGLVEFRGFEMAPDVEMSLATQLLVRGLFARFCKKPFLGPLPDLTTELHDRYLLPHYVWTDFLDVLDDLREHGLGFDPGWFDRQFEFRFPEYGEVSARDVRMELRMALEPWHVMGEEGGQAGTVRYVDSSVERVQVKLDHATPGRHVVLANGRPVPMQRTTKEGELVGGVRFRAWQPPRCLHPTIGVHAPLVLELVDLYRGRAVAGCTYHVSHPGGLSHENRPVNSSEAEGRRLARFVPFGSTGLAERAIANLGAERRSSPLSYTLDLLRS